MEPKTNTDSRYVGRFDWQEVTPQLAIVEAIETAASRDNYKLDVLYRYIDPDVLESLFDGRSNPQEIELSFTCDRFRVTIRNDGFLFVEPADVQSTDR